MRSGERRRAALFALVCLALVASALAFALRGTEQPGGEEGFGLHTHSHSPAGHPTSAIVRREARRARRLSASLHRSARRFLAAFLRYEVGESDAAVLATLRATATADFLRGLLAAPPRAPTSGFPPPAHLRNFHLGFVSAANRALLSGTASRGGRLERFSFLLRRHGSAWLASGLGQ